LDFKGAGFNACLASAGLDSPIARLVFCYPLDYEGACDFHKLASEALSIGVESICVGGPVRLDFVSKDLRVLGKGHAGLVVAVNAEGTLKALKVRRQDSKRASIAVEAERLIIGSRVGATPAVYGYTDNMILMDFAGSFTLGSAMQLSSVELTDAILGALRAARALDTVNILHAEIHRPFKNVLYPNPARLSTALIVDLDSAANGCGNASRIAGSLLVRLCGFIPAELRHSLSRYSRGCEQSEYRDLERLVLEAFAHGCKLADDNKGPQERS
jgi:putative serine/threonine protein kinase